MKRVIVTPAGRSRYLRILAGYLSAAFNQNIFDEWHLWVNTANADDRKFMIRLADTYSFVKIVPHPANPNSPFYSNETIHHFFPFAYEPDTVYLRLDDDVCYAHPESIKRIFDFRIENPEYFLISGNVINNAICSHIHQINGALGEEKGIVGFNCLDKVGLLDPKFAEYVHYSAFPTLSHDLFSLGQNKFFIKNTILEHYERISINAISWLGSEFAKFGGKVGMDEEDWLTAVYPREIRKPVMILGDALFAHFAFAPQRAYLEDYTNWLGRYDNLSSIFRKYQTKF